MARIRTVKPQLARHLPLYELEKQTGLPMRFIWAMLPTVCDREGRFTWRPWEIKLDICPYDNFDFSKAMDALHQNGMVEKYEVEGEIYGHIPSFLAHQVINNRESQSVIPGIAVGRLIRFDASATRHGPASGEGKGREEEGKGKGSSVESTREIPPPASPPSRDASGPGTSQLIALYCELWKDRYKSPGYPPITGKDGNLLKGIAKNFGYDRTKVLIEAYLQMPDSWFVTKTHDIPTMNANLNKIALFADSGRMVSKAETRKLDNLVAQTNLLNEIERDGV